MEIQKKSMLILIKKSNNLFKKRKVKDNIQKKFKNKPI